MARRRVHRLLLERLEIAVGPPRRVVMFLESGKRLVSELVRFNARQQGATARLNLPAADLKADDRGLHSRAPSLPLLRCDRFTSPATISSQQGRRAACYALEVRPDLWRAIGRSRGATSLTTTAVCWICSVIEKTTALRPCNRAQVAAAPPFHVSCDGIAQDRARKFRMPLFFTSENPRFRAACQVFLTDYRTLGKVHLRFLPSFLQ